MKYLQASTIPFRDMRRRSLIAILAPAFVSHAIGAPLLNQEAERLQRELGTELPRGSDKATILATFRKRGWEPVYDPILKNYGFLIKERTGKNGILVRVWLDHHELSSRVEVKAIYSPDLG